MRNKSFKVSWFISATALILSTNFISAEDDSSVSRAEYEALAARVSALEANSAVNSSDQLDSITSKVIAALPVNSEEKTTLIKSVVAAVKKHEQNVNFPWMDNSKWALISNGQSVDQVVTILGKPTLNEPSLRKWVDFVYTYQGRRPATNQRIVGKVRFRKGVVVDFERPVID
jgi:outer membrane protein assembly factor BamE (lipoprotein component of BamABCDE complex)